MNFLEHYYNKKLKYDLINKFFYLNLKKLPKLKKIVLNFNCKTTELKTLATHLLALELIANQKAVLTISKRPNLLLKIRKGNPVGCKVILKKYSMLHFISKSLNEIFSNIKDFDGIKINLTTETHSFSFLIQNTLHFSKLNEHYYLFNNLSSLNLSFIMLGLEIVYDNLLFFLFIF